MKGNVTNLLGNELILLPEKAVYLPAHHALCIADWHLGKALHFRKAGVALPQPKLSTEFARVDHLIVDYAVKKVILLGDLFHSQLNTDWQDLAAFIRQHNTVEWHLTIGNHDIIPPEKYMEIGVACCKEYALGNTVACRHQPARNLSENILLLTGHIHPGYLLRSAARIQYRFPCFYYDGGVFTLPAFGGLTGLHPVEKNTQNRIFVIIDDIVQEVK